MKRPNILSLIFAIVMTSLFAGSLQSAAKAEQKKLKMGILMPLTGYGAAWGIPTVRSQQIMIDKINSEGGIKVGNDAYLIDPVVMDTECKNEAALARANKLIFEEGVKYINGPIFPGPVAAVQSVSEPNKVIIWVTCYSPKALGPDFPYTFRFFPSGIENMSTMFPFIKKYHPNVKTIALTGLADERETVLKIADMAKEAGYEVVIIEHVPAGTPDWFPVLTKVAAKNPDAIVPVSAPPPEQAMILQQLHQLGYKGLVISPSHFNPDDLVAKAGVEATEGFTFMAADFSPNGRPDLVYLHNKYIERYGEPFDPVTCATFGYFDVIKQAIEKAGTTDTTTVMKTLEHLKSESVLGPISFGGLKTYGIKRQIIEPVCYSKMHNGKLVYVGSMIPSVP
jgi:branched-chain amino acid transport system substrate-binding protein